MNKKFKEGDRVILDLSSFENEEIKGIYLKYFSQNVAHEVMRVFKERIKIKSILGEEKYPRIDYFKLFEKERNEI